MVMFSERPRNHHIGHILLGFAILMVGMDTMSTAVRPLQEQESFVHILTSFSNPMLDILVGAVFTAILQSASAAVGILQAMTLAGTIPFDVAFPLIMGISIGAAMPVLLAAVSASSKGKRASLFYLIGSIMGVLIIAIPFYLLDSVLYFAFMSSVMSSVTVALLNTLFRLMIVPILLPLIFPLEKAMEKLIPDHDKIPTEIGKLNLLEERLIGHPALASEQCRIVVEDMMEITRKNLINAMSLQESYSTEEHTTIDEKECLVDAYEDRLNSYMLHVTQGELDGNQSAELSKYMHTITDFERLSDHAVNLAVLSKERYEKKIVLSDEAKAELQTVQNAVLEIISLVFEAYSSDNITFATQVEALDKVIASLCAEIRLRHMQRLENGRCAVEAGFYLNDVLGNCKRIADHCSNVSIGMISVRLGSCDTHEYQGHLRNFKTGDFESFYRRYAMLYTLP